VMRGGAAMQLLEIVGYAWPLALIAVGVYLLLRRRS
jgi:MYXO-CTERM domain-containing protein